MQKTPEAGVAESVLAQWMALEHQQQEQIIAVGERGGCNNYCTMIANHPLGGVREPVPH